MDILIPPRVKDTSDSLHQVLLAGDHEFLNAENAAGLYDMLTKGMGIRVARKDQFIPNIELKFLKDDIDRHVLVNRTAVNIPGASLYISPVDLRIAYKIYPGSDKDIEDAVCLWEIFKNDLDSSRMKGWMEKSGVRGDEYGIIV